MGMKRSRRATLDPELVTFQQGREGPASMMMKAGKRYLVSLWLHEDEFVRLTDLAKSAGVSRAIVVRQFINKELAAIDAQQTTH